jgi:hypothetical protein
MNSEDNGHTTRPISRFSRASRDSLSNDASAQPSAASTRPVSRTSFPASRQNDSIASAPVNPLPAARSTLYDSNPASSNPTRTPVFRSGEFPPVFPPTRFSTPSESGRLINEVEQASSRYSEPPPPAPAPLGETSIPAMSAHDAEALELSRPEVPSGGGLAWYIPQQARDISNLLTRVRIKPGEGEERQASKILRQIRHESVRVAAKSAQVASKARQEIAHNLKASELKKNYRKMLTFAHVRVFDRKLEPLFFIPTQAPGRQLVVASRGQVSPSAYEGPTPQLVFDWALAGLPQDLREFAFVDFRAGRGRAVMLAARRNFEKVIGYEFDDQTYDDLAMNVAQFPRSQMVCRNVECHRGDRVGVSIPDQPAVLFFSNAHRDELLPVVLNYAATSHQRNPRSIYLVLLNPGKALPAGTEDVFKSVPWPLIDRVKLALLSPVQVAVYHAAP